MRTNSLFLLFFLIIITSCSNKQSYVIKGDLTNEAYSGKTIYLVSKNDNRAEITDSTIITNGKFVFKETIKEPKFFYLNIHPVWPQLMQELMFIAEPGIIKVSIDTKSKCSGTNLNESLEKWKTVKLDFDAKRNKLYTDIYKIKKLKNPDQEKINSLKNDLEDSEKQYISITSDIILNNNQNILGQYLLKIYFNKIEHERKVEILSTASESFLNDEKIQKLLKDINYKY